MNQDEMNRDMASFIGRGLNPSLDRIATAASYFDHPQNAHPVLHVAGTNGKGSTCYFMAQCLAFNGWNVGLYSSPHIQDYRERIQIYSESHPHGDWISEKDLLLIHSRLKEKLPENHSLTYYEWSVLTALVYFAEQKLDAVILETGMGGRWDGTNICNAHLSLITTIGLDHQEYLGDTKEAILNEKLAIVKKGGTLLFGPQDHQLQKQANEYCDVHEAEFLQGCDRSKWSSDYLKSNRELAAQAAEIFAAKLDRKISIQSKELWQPPKARFQILSESPLVILDGAHNEQGTKALASYLKEKGIRNYDLYFGCLVNRDLKILIEPLLAEAATVTLVSFDAADKTQTLDVLQQAQQEMDASIYSVEDVVNRIKENEFEEKAQVICGSLYLSSQILSLWN